MFPILFTVIKFVCVDTKIQLIFTSAYEKENDPFNKMSIYWCPSTPIKSSFRIQFSYKLGLEGCLLKQWAYFDHMSEKHDFLLVIKGAYTPKQCFMYNAVQ